MKTARSGNPESGYALLFVYCMAATVAILLYMQLPRAAFEAQRDKEQLLIDRGEQYTRAITLYVRKFNRFPADFDALESSQNLRFLRRRYPDPMTGKDEWRIIHVGPGGVFTDSVLYTKKKDPNQPQAEKQTFITEMQQVGGNPVDPNAAQNVNAGTRRRASDQAGAPGQAGAVEVNTPPGSLDPNAQHLPGAVDANGQPLPGPVGPNGQPMQGTIGPNGQPIPGFNGLQPGQVPNGPVQVLPDGRVVPVGVGNQALPPPQTPPAFQLTPGAPTQPAGQFPPGVAVQPGAQQPSGFGIQPGMPAIGAAAAIINNQLLNPRPGGAPAGIGQAVDQFGRPVAAPATPAVGTPVSQAAPPQTGQTIIGGGIGGVASKKEQEGIKTYRDRTTYNEWEFVYDLTKDTSMAGRAGAATPQQPAQPAAPSNSFGVPVLPPSTPPLVATPQ